MYSWSKLHLQATFYLVWCRQSDAIWQEKSRALREQSRFPAVTGRGSAPPGPRAKAALAQPVPRPAAEGSTAPGGTSQPAPHRSLGWGQPFGKPEGSSAGLRRGSAGMPVLGASRGDPCVSYGGQRLSTRQGDFCIRGAFYNRARTSLRFLSWKALKFLPVWLILSQTCSAHRKIAMIFFFLVKVSFSRICWAKAKLMFFVRKLRFVPKHRTAGTGPSEGHQKLRFPPGQCGCSLHYLLPALGEKTTSFLASYQLCFLRCGLTCLPTS